MTDETRIIRLLELRARVDNDIRRLERRIAGARVRRRRKRAECGTEGGYYHHIRQTKTRPCDDCRAAHSVAERVRRLQRKTEREAAA